MLKQIGTGITLFFLLAATLGCQGDPYPRKDSLIVALPQEPILLDPRLSTDYQGRKIGQLIFNGLLRVNERLDLENDLAETFEQISPTSYRFVLKKGIRFHDGTPLTAKDVLFTLESWKDPNLKSYLRAQAERIAKITIEGDDTGIIELKEPYAPFPTVMTLGVVPAHLAGAKDFERKLVGTGPYRFVGWRKGSNILLKSNSLYFRTPPKLTHLIFQVVKDDNTRLLKMLAGEADLIQNDVEPVLLERVRIKEGLVIDSGPGSVVAYINFNTKDPALSDKRVRQAIAYAIDKQEIIRYKWEGFATSADSIFFPTNWSYTKAPNDYAYNPEKAKQLLDQAGFKDPDGDGPQPRLSITFKTSTNKQRIAITQMIAHQLARVGIQVRVNSFEWATLSDDIRRGRFQMYTSSWGGLTEPDFYFDLYHSSQFAPEGLNRSFYVNKQIDSLTEKGRAAMEETKRREYYAEVQRMINEDLPSFPLWYEHNIVIYRKELKDVRFRPDASYLPFIDMHR